MLIIGVSKSTNARFRIRMFPAKDLIRLEVKITPIIAVFPTVHTSKIATHTVIFGILNPSDSGGESRLLKGVPLEAVPGSAVELFISAAAYDSTFTVPWLTLLLIKNFN